MNDRDFKLKFLFSFPEEKNRKSMESPKMPIMMIAGMTEAKLIISTIIDRTYETQKISYDFYIQKLTDLFNNLYVDPQMFMRPPFDGSQTIDDIKNYILNILETDFLTYKSVDFRLFNLSYYIWLMFDCIQKKNEGNIKSFSTDPSNSLKYLLKNNCFKDVIQYKTVATNSIIGVLPRNIFDYVPFFGKYCAFGFKTFLELYLKYQLFPVGHGYNCITVHGSITIPYQVMIHDQIHYNICKHHTLKKPDNIRIALKIYDIVENGQLLHWVKMGIYIYLFIFTHERPDHDITPETLSGKRAINEGKHTLKTIINETSGGDVYKFQRDLNIYEPIPNPIDVWYQEFLNIVTITV